MLNCSKPATGSVAPSNISIDVGGLDIPPARRLKMPVPPGHAMVTRNAFQLSVEGSNHESGEFNPRLVAAATLPSRITAISATALTMPIS